MRYEESAVLELKEQVNADFKKEIIAFANTDGGEIFVGVAKDGSITGVENAEAEMERIGNMIRDGIKPYLKEHQRDFMPEDTKAGMIQAYLDKYTGRERREETPRHGVAAWWRLFRRQWSGASLV